MNKMINSLLKLMGISDEIEIKINNFIIGTTNYIILEIPSESNIIKNKIVSKILLRHPNVYWFRSYNELERWGDYLIGNDQIIFILVG